MSRVISKPELTKGKLIGSTTNLKTVTMAKTEEDCSKCTAIDTIMSQVRCITILGNSSLENFGFLQGGLTTLGSLIGSSPVRANNEAVEYKSKRTSEILDPELNLGRLGYSGGDGISWEKVLLPEKKNLYLELYSRITNYT